MKKSLIVLAVAGLAAAGTAAAGSYTVRFGDRGPTAFIAVQDNDFRGRHDDGRRLGVDDRQSRIAQQIESGVRNGALTRREARLLGGQLAATENKERAFESDGRLSGRERTELHRDLDVVAQRLRFERHDSDRRY